jgi:hypothetical protein
MTSVYEEALAAVAARRKRKAVYYAAWVAANYESNRAYRTAWQRAKRASDPDYRKRESVRQSEYASKMRKCETPEQREKRLAGLVAWRAAHPEYSRKWRAKRAAVKGRAQ